MGSARGFPGQETLTWFPISDQQGILLLFPGCSIKKTGRTVRQGPKTERKEAPCNRRPEAPPASAVSSALPPFWDPQLGDSLCGSAAAPPHLPAALATAWPGSCDQNAGHVPTRQQWPLVRASTAGTHTLSSSQQPGRGAGWPDHGPEGSQDSGTSLAPQPSVLNASHPPGSKLQLYPIKQQRQQPQAPIFTEQ